MRIRLALLAIVVLFSYSKPIIAQPDQSMPELPKFSTRVHVKVSAPESVINAIMNLITNELRALGDVIITERNPGYRLTVMVIPNRTKEEMFGFTFSVVITRPLDANILSPLLLSDRLDEKEKSLLLYLSGRYELIEKQSLVTSSKENIPATCHDIVRSFNNDLIEKDRKLWHSVWGPLLKEPAFPVPGQEQE
jgi:hypothetical protein